MITQHVLGITKRQAIEFLKKKEVYQLTRDPNKAVNKPLLASRPYQIYAIDLVDVARYKQGNNRFIFILTCVDLFSGYTWFEPLRNKESKDVLEAFKRIIRESDDHLPKSVISDNGLEFRGALESYFKENKIKHIFTKSYTPQPNVEAANKQLRKIMRELFVKTGKLVWYKSLKDIQKAKNTQWNENHKDMPKNILQKYDVDSSEDKTRIANMAKIQRQKNKEKLKAYKEDTLHVGDHVRIRLATQQSQLREKIKAGKKKLIVVHFSPDVYRIKQVFPPQQNRLGQYKYTLENAEGKFVERQGKDYAERFKRIDLLKVGANQKTILSQTDANTLNKLNDPYVDAEKRVLLYVL
jgi:transposase InsO family protein